MPPIPFLIAAELPDADKLKEKLHEILARPDYQLDPVSKEPSFFEGWWLEVLRWILKPIEWLFGLTEGLNLGVRVVLTTILTILLVALIAHIIWSLSRAMRGHANDREKLPLEDERITNPEELEALAEQAAAKGQAIEAIRWLFRACLARLELFERKSFRRGTTNREHLRRYRGTQLFSPLEVLVKTIELKWFGDEPCLPDDWTTCRAAHAEITRLVTEGAARAHSA